MNNDTFVWYYWNDKEFLNWYLYSIQPNENYAIVLQQFKKIIIWIQSNVDGYEKHCRWRVVDNTLEAKFRHERDYIMFKLRWS